jgi:ABC-2 type transport system ATP-binding protein
VGDVIQMNHIHHQFGKQSVLKDFCLDVKRGTIYGLLGKNGSGKTTAIRILLGLLSPESGRSTVLGLDSQQNDFQIRAKVGYLGEWWDVYN